MSTRSVIVRLEAEVAGFIAGMGKAAQATDNVAKKAAQARKSMADNRQSMETAGTSMAAFGTVSVAALGASAKAAMDWESAWAGVTKTVDGSPEQMAALEGELRNLAKTLPATHEEIAAVAEAAGQLGVKREDVAGFTRTMIDLGETTNLTADEAATSIAQISNVMGTMAREGSEGVDRFGATLVALGNAGASTEKDILEMSKRLVGAGKLIGASEADVLAMANAMASVGIEAELGGGVMSRVMQRMYADVQDGGEGLERLAKTAGVSSKEFATAFESDPVRAVDMVVKGLGRVKDEGGNVIQTMEDLGIKGTEETSVILRLAGAGDLLSDSLKLGADAWKQNSALANEAAKRYETTESKVKIAWNNIKDAAIEAGAATLPIIQGLAEGVSGLAQGFGDLPGPVQGTVTALAGVVGVSALVAGGLLTVIPKVADTHKAFQDLRASGSKVPGVITGIGKAAGVAAAAYTALATAAALSAAATDGSRHKTTVADFNNLLSGVAKNGDAARKALDGAFEGVLNPDMWSGGTTAVNDFEGALSRIFKPSWQDSATDFRDTLFGQNASSGINASKDAIGNYDKALASMVSSGNFEDAAAGFKMAADEAAKQDISVEKLAELFPQYKDAILSAKTANGETQVSQEALTGAMLKADPALTDAGKAAVGTAETIEDVGTAAEQSAEQAQDLVDSLLGINNANLAAADSQLGFDQAIADAAKNWENAGAGVDYLNEKTGEFNQTAADNAKMLNDIAARGNSVAETVFNQTGSYEEFRKSLDGSRQSLFDVAKAYYPTEKAAWAYVDSVMAIPPEMLTEVNITDNNTIQGVNQNLLLLHDSIQKTPNKTVIIKEPMSPAIKKGLENLGYIVTTLPDGTIKVTETGTTATGQKIDATARKQRIATITAAAQTGTAEAQLNETARPRTVTFFEKVIRSISTSRVGEGTVLAPGKAAGGDLDMAPGPKGVDSQLFFGAKGEHVLTAREVDLMGGQDAVYRFRANVRSGNFQGLAGGGAVGNRVSSTQIMAHPPSPAATLAGPMEMVGTLELNADATKATFRGMALQAAHGAIAATDAQSRYKRTGR